LLIKYIKSVLWRVAKHLSYIEDARCLKVNIFSRYGAFGIVTGYGLDCPVGASYSIPVQKGPGAHPAFCTMDIVSISRK